MWQVKTTREDETMAKLTSARRFQTEYHPRTDGAEKPSGISRGVWRREAAFGKKTRRPMSEEFLDDLEDNPDPARAWNRIKSFSGSPHSSAFCEPLLHNGRTFLTNTVKANGFVQQYAAVNRLSFDKTERSQTRHLKKALQLPTTLLP